MGKIADDRLRGAKAIADELGESEWQVRYGIDRGRIPAVKEGGVWCASREFCANGIEQKCGRDEQWRRIKVGERASASATAERR